MRKSMTGTSYALRMSALEVVLALCGSLTSAQEIGDIIRPVVVTAERPDTHAVSDLFYAKTYDLHFRDHPAIGVSYDRQSNTVVFQARNGFTGATLVEFDLGGERYVIPVLAQNERTKRSPHVFRYRPANTPARVVVTGTFNNWNTQSDVLADLEQTGLYEKTVSLEPGSYLYKFVVDGRFVLDPANPEKSPTGFDDFNSVLRVVDPDTERVFLHAGTITTDGRDRVLSFNYERTPAAEPLTTGDVLALLDNRQIPSRNVATGAGVVTLRLSRGSLAGDRTIRVLVSKHGRQSNLQQVRLRDGVPAGSVKSSASWEDGIIYSVMIDRFENGDRSNDHPIVHDSLFAQANYQGGDLRGIINRIEAGYFDSLGANILWISPVYDNPNVAFQEYPPPHRWYSGYHGYWPISDTAVEEKFGTMEELKQLIATAHRHRIRVLLDFVAHHVHIDHPFYRDHPEWFGSLDLADGRKNLRLWDEFRLSTWFEPYMPSFDFTKSPEALEIVSRNAIWWLKETGADGFRHDAVKHVPNSFWRSLTRRVKEEIDIPRRTHTYQIGETFGDYDLIASYVANGQLTAQFNFNLSYFAIPVFLDPQQSFASLDFHMKRSFASFGQYHSMGNIMDSHDKVRFMAYADGKVKDQGVDMREMAWNNPPKVDHPSSYKKAELYLAYMFTIPGLPVVYYGSEFGMTGADDPDNRRMMRFGDNLDAQERRMLSRTQAIARMRSAHSALRYGDFLTLLADESIYAYLRADFNERLLVVLNKQETSQTIELILPRSVKAQSLVNVLTGEAIRVRVGRSNIAVDGYGWRVLQVLGGKVH